MSLICRLLLFRYIEFYYNSHEIDSAREFANKHGLNFEVIQGVGESKNDLFKDFDNQYYLQQIEQSKGKRSPEDSGKVCPLLLDIAAIDYRGDAYLCCAVPTHSALRIGKYSDFSEDELL